MIMWLCCAFTHVTMFVLVCVVCCCLSCVVVMASAGPLLLLLSFMLLFFTASTTPTVKHNQQGKSSEPAKLNQEEKVPSEDSRLKGYKQFGNILCKNINQIRLATTPWLSMIPVAGPFISAFVNLALFGC